MKNVSLRSFVLILLGFSALFWFALAKLEGLDLQNFLDFIRPIPKVVTLDLLLISLFIKWGWRWKSLQGWLVPFPDLNGTWVGQLQTNWKDECGDRPSAVPIMLTIRQSFLHISCVMRTAEMTSHSYVDGFLIDQDRQIRQLSYTYTSKPSISIRNRSTPHDGTVLLNIVGNPVERLAGEYWTQRETTGTITLTLKTREILDSLPDDFPAHPLS